MPQDSTIINTIDQLTGGYGALQTPDIGPDLTHLADTVAASDIFGGGSRLVEMSAGPGAYTDWILTGNIPYSLAVLFCLVGSCMLMYYFRPYAVTVAGIFRGTLYIEKLMDEHNYIFETFRKLLILSGLFVTGLLVVRYCDALWGARIEEALPGWAELVPVPVVWVALMAVWICQNLILHTAGWLTYATRFTQDLVSLRNLCYGLIFLFSLPLMFTVSLAGKGALPVLSWMMFTVIGLLLIFMLLRTYMLFIRQKISILYWFLYLCAVEILPVSFLVVLASRNL